MLVQFEFAEGFGGSQSDLNIPVTQSGEDPLGTFTSIYKGPVHVLVQSNRRFNFSVAAADLSDFRNGSIDTSFDNDIFFSVVPRNGGDLVSVFKIDNLIRHIVGPGELCDRNSAQTPLCRSGNTCAQFNEEAGVCCPTSECTKCGRDAGNALVCGDSSVTVQFETHRLASLYANIPDSLSESGSSVVTNELGSAFFPPDNMLEFEDIVEVHFETFVPVVVDGSGGRITQSLLVPYSFTNNDSLAITVTIPDVFFPVGLGEQCDAALKLFCDPTSASCASKTCSDCDSGYVRTCCPLDEAGVACPSCGRNASNDFVCGTHSLSAQLSGGTPNQLQGISVQLRRASQNPTRRRQIFFSVTGIDGVARFEGIVPGERHILSIDPGQPEMDDAVDSEGNTFLSPIQMPAFVDNAGLLDVVVAFTQVHFKAEQSGCEATPCKFGSHCVAPASVCTTGTCDTTSPSVCCSNACNICGKNGQGDVACGAFVFVVRLAMMGTAEQQAGVEIVVAFGETVKRATTNANGEAQFTGIVPYTVFSISINHAQPEFADARDMSGNVLTTDIVINDVFFRNGDALRFVFPIVGFKFATPQPLLGACNDLSLPCGAGLQCAPLGCVGPECATTDRVCCPQPVGEAPCSACGSNDQNVVVCGEHTLSAVLAPIGAFAPTKLTGVVVERRLLNVLVGSETTNASGVASFAGVPPNKKFEMWIDISQSAMVDARHADGSAFTSTIVIDAGFVNGDALSVVRQFDDLLFATELGGTCSVSAQCQPGVCPEARCTNCSPTFERRCCPADCTCGIAADSTAVTCGTPVVVVQFGSTERKRATAAQLSDIALELRLANSASPIETTTTDSNGAASFTTALVPGESYVLFIDVSQLKFADIIDSNTGVAFASNIVSPLSFQPGESFRVTAVLPNMEFLAEMPGTPAPTPEATPSPTPEVTPSPTPEVTPSPTPEVTMQVTPRPTPQVTPSPTPAPTPSPTPSPTPAPTPSSRDSNNACDKIIDDALDDYAKLCRRRESGRRSVCDAGQVGQSCFNTAEACYDELRRDLDKLAGDCEDAAADDDVLKVSDSSPSCSRRCGEVFNKRGDDKDDANIYPAVDSVCDALAAQWSAVYEAACKPYTATSCADYCGARESEVSNGLAKCNSDVDLWYGESFRHRHAARAPIDAPTCSTAARSRSLAAARASRSSASTSRRSARAAPSTTRRSTVATVSRPVSLRATPRRAARASTAVSRSRSAPRAPRRSATACSTTTATTASTAASRGRTSTTSAASRRWCRRRRRRTRRRVRAPPTPRTAAPFRAARSTPARQRASRPCPPSTSPRQPSSVCSAAPTCLTPTRTTRSTCLSFRHHRSQQRRRRLPRRQQRPQARLRPRPPRQCPRRRRL